MRWRSTVWNGFAIVDFDVHHGNGTEEIFAGDERVLMASFFSSIRSIRIAVRKIPRKNMVNVPLPAGTNGEKKCGRSSKRSGCPASSSSSLR